MCVNIKSIRPTRIWLNYHNGMRALMERYLGPRQINSQWAGTENRRDNSMINGSELQMKYVSFG